MDAPKPKRKVKPRKLLDPKNTTPAAKALMAANAHQSPLLRLSPEIRNRIYKLVLGGRAVHVFAAGYDSILLNSICTSPNVDEETGDSASSESRSSWLEPYSHVRCWNQKSCPRGAEQPTKLDLSLLRVCKQIHEEAALLPFLTNTFLVQSTPQLALFSDHLLSAQRSAVANVVLDMAALRLNMRFPGLSQAEKARLRRLTGLKTLRVHVRVHWSMRELDLSMRDLKFHLAHWLEVLPRRSLDATTVRFRAPRSGCEKEEGLTKPFPKAYAAWTLEAEKALLQKTNE